jgi:peptidoglycan/xylan/chitin deacetylase (PgdA/CDA1 family)
MTLAPILMYHAVGRARDGRFRRWVVSPSLLAEHLAALRESDYEFVGLTEWASQKQVLSPLVVLTFDDGYADFAEQALPVLDSYGASATVYVVTGYIGGQARWLPYEDERARPIMTWNDLQSIGRLGIEVGSHGHRHIELDAVPPAVAEADVQGSRDVLTEEGFSANSFCYPFGYVNRRVRGIVARAGFDTACVVGRGLADSQHDLLRLRRLEVNHRTTPEALLQRFEGPAVQASARFRQAAQPTWRLTRRLRSVVRRTVQVETRQ